ncbi:MAG: type IV pilus twitching motility protein PilT [Deltaproteobacteria bacterium]|nr:type IV pilus twitching motility protein PilT [Deltaproteobacteria bacterium]
MASIVDLLVQMRRAKGSDLHLAAGLEPRIRTSGHLEVVSGWPVLDDKAIRGLLREIADDQQWADYERTGDLDFTYGLEGVARFRSNFFRQEKGAGAVFRLVPEKIVPLEELKLPPVIAKFADIEQGLVLVTGPTGSGKSTTMAAILDRINATKAKHIVTIEDPVEFVHQNKMSVFSHREVGSHTKAFGPALRAAVRQDADIIVVGEMRDLETIALAIGAAEMGAVVFGTLHTNSAPKTIDRLIDAFPADQQPQVRTTLSESLAGVVAQQLVPNASGEGRTAVNEILLKTPGLPNLIREGKTQMIQSLMQAGRGLGMQLMDDALMKLVQEKRILAKDAYMKANNKSLFERLLA